MEEFLFSALNEFTNSNNEIRSNAENAFFQILDQNPFQVLEALVNIIQKDPNAKASFCALIQICKFMDKGVYSQNGEEKRFPTDVVLSIRNFCVSFFQDPNFPKELHDYLEPLIQKFYIFSKMKLHPEFPEIWDLLDNLFNSPKFYSDAMSLYQFLIQGDKEKVHFVFDNHEKISFVISHLQSADLNEAANTLIFLLRFWVDTPDLLKSLPIVEILRVSNDKHFKSIISLVIEYCNKEIIQNPQLEIDIFKLLFDNISNNLSDESASVFFLYYFRVCLFLLNSCKEVFLNQLPTFLNFFTMIFSNPYQNIDLYNETLSFFNDINQNFIHDNFRKAISQYLIEYSQSNNLYLSSSCISFLPFLQYLDKAFEFASNPDPIIRANGLACLKKIINEKTTYKHPKQYKYKIDDHINYVYSQLMNIYLLFDDYMSLKIFSKWCLRANPEMIALMIPSIMEVCSKKPSLGTFICGSRICYLKNHETDSTSQQELKIYGSTMEKMIVDLLKEDDDIIVNMLEYLTPVLRILGEKESLLLLNNVIIPSICRHFDCLFSKSMIKLAALLGPNFNQFEGQIMSSLLSIICDEEFQNTAHAIKACSYYGIFFENFQSNYLMKVVQYSLKVILLYQKREDILSLIFSALGRFITYYSENRELFAQVFPVPFYIIQNCNTIRSFKISLKLINKLAYSQFCIDESMMNIFQTFFYIVNQSYQIVDQFLSNNIPDNNDMYEIQELVYNINQFFDILWEKVRNPVVELFCNHFWQYDNLQKYHHVSFQMIIVHMWCTVIAYYEIPEINSIIPSIINNLFAVLQSDMKELHYQALNGLKQLSISYHLNENQINMYLQMIFSILSNPNIPSNLCNVSINILINFTNRYGIQMKEPTMIQNVCSTLPLCSRLDDLSFQQLINIIRFCIQNDEYSNFAEEIIKILCKLIQSNVISDTILRTFVKERELYQGLPQLFPLIQEADQYIML